MAGVASAALSDVAREMHVKMTQGLHVISHHLHHGGECVAHP
jgi:hypothetical protein